MDFYARGDAAESGDGGVDLNACLLLISGVENEDEWVYMFIFLFLFGFLGSLGALYMAGMEFVVSSEFEDTLLALFFKR